MKFIHDSAVERCGERMHVPIKAAIYMGKLLNTDQLSKEKKYGLKRSFLSILVKIYYI